MAQATAPVLDSTIGSPSVRAWAECLNDDLRTASSQEADRPVWQLQRPLVSARQRRFRRSRAILGARRLLGSTAVAAPFAGRVQHRAIRPGRRPSIIARMRRNRSRGTATSAIWNTV
jgi:hypothetical protein